MIMPFDINLRKDSARKLQERVLRQDLDRIGRRAISGVRGRQGWAFKAPSVPNPKALVTGYQYNVTFSFHKKPGKSSANNEEEFEALKAIVEKAARSKRWYFPSEDGESNIILPAKPTTVRKPAEYKIALGDHFDNIYDREPQIQVVVSAIEAFQQSQRQNKFHTILYGYPASGKTEILLRVAEMLGEDAVVKMDATSTTKAGAQRKLLEADPAPLFLIIEEIEKTRDEDLRWLLGLLDQRGEIRKLTYRGESYRLMDILCMATVNDIKLFKSVMSGALASRFANKVYCPRPDKAILHKILTREIQKVQGDPKWIAPTLTYCTQNKIDDPREVIRICLCGREKLMTGQYQKWLRATKAPDNRMWK